MGVFAESHSPQGVKHTVGVSSDLLRTVVSVLKTGDKTLLTRLLKILTAPDIAGVIEVVSAARRALIVTALSRQVLPDVLLALGSKTRRGVLSLLSSSQVARALSSMDSDDAVEIFEDVDAQARREILKRMSIRARAALQRIMEYPSNSAGRLMQTNVVSVPPHWNVGEVVDYLREDQNLPEVFHEVFVIDPRQRLQGRISLSRLARNQRETQIKDLIQKSPLVFSTDTDQEDVAYQFEKYGQVSAPVLGPNDRLLGVVTADDVVGIAKEELEEDIRGLSGIGEESLSDNVGRAAWGRLLWLFVNLLAAFVASMVISIFDDALEKMVALAILMPIISSLGGNAAIQTLTVTVRAMATRELDLFSTVGVTIRQVFINLLNGLFLAILLGIVGWAWFQDFELGLVLLAAMLFNMGMAGLVGISVPLCLRRVGVDPAVASGVLVTGIIDVIGFFTFLGLAAWSLL